MKSLLLLICIIATLGLQVPAAKIKRQVVTTTVCEGKDNVMVGMPGSCSGFFFCIEGSAIASSCGSFYHFNSRLGICDYPDNDLCSDSPSVKEVSTDAEAMDVCERAAEGYIFGKSKSCTLFYVCRQKQAVRRVCPPQKHFNAEAKLCQKAEQSQCPYVAHLEIANGAPAHELTVPATPDSPPNISLILPASDKMPGQVDYSKMDLSPTTICSGQVNMKPMTHPWNCEKFIFCLGQHSMEMQCPSGLHFNSQTQRCDLPSVAKCMQLNVFNEDSN